MIVQSICSCASTTIFVNDDVCDRSSQIVPLATGLSSFSNVLASNLASQSTTIRNARERCGTYGAADGYTVDIVCFADEPCKIDNGSVAAHSRCKHRYVNESGD